MLFTETPLQGAYVINLEKRQDHRGFFARTWDINEFKTQGLETGLVQANTSFNTKKGTLRGMHFQASPYEETKIVRCIRGTIYDVIIDLRPDSNTYTKWFGIELSEENSKLLYVPKGFAHGFVTLTDHTEVTYLVTEFYTPAADRGVRYNDPAFGIAWPIVPTHVSEKDANFPDYKPIKNKRV